MKVGILAGGLGSRLSEETTVKPKPMVEIGEHPILWHIMKYYAHFGHHEFAIALGYKGEYIKRWFADRASLAGHLSIDTASGEITQSGNGGDEQWKVDLIETGRNTNTGGRIKRLVPYLGTDGTFMVTWGDGLSTVDLDALLDFHKSHGKICTLTAVHPPARYGHIEIVGDQITEFTEKPQAAEGWINGAFFVMEPEIADYIDGDDTLFEREPLERLASLGELMAYQHTDFWACMDTMRDKVMLEKLWETPRPPWKVWS
ncbi:MAG: glucose-1-phosphate cytidylyltransferase [Ilumatobacter sp.]|uniref:glucose-1-phosphate cytidylyltransferase n=1 Tax=Ilumatobacter sp. TaxID=1967498 RepID=UPI00261B2231|nr:glucose-1-phosphate cytidylyltransferase [Ilumatobacter sp.]MDJ0768700.1 glucose-1-phosphate cytidylyltransferase [Ilumatobacter sp.]